MRTQRNTVETITRRVTDQPIGTRREQRGNVIQWREQAAADRTLRLIPGAATPAATTSDPSLLTMIIATPFVLALWALFGWAVNELIDYVRGVL